MDLWRVMAIVLDLDFESSESPNTSHEQLENKASFLANPATYVFNAAYCFAFATAK